MKTLTLALALGFASFAMASDSFKLIHVAELKSMLASKNAKVAVFDANGESTRKKEGVIPGAKLLTRGFDVTKTLPAEKSTQLVFYCANEQCMASHDAAKKAVDAGYPNVNVLADGIMGWRKAGEPVSKN